MKYYELTKTERDRLKEKIEESIHNDLHNNILDNIIKYSSDTDTYIRKNVYSSIGKIYKNQPELRSNIIKILHRLFTYKDEKIRQTVVYSLGEIGKENFKATEDIFIKTFNDTHHSVLNAVTGALKQLGQKNSKPTLKFIKGTLPSQNSQIQAKLLHGLELRGRTHPEEVLPILYEYQKTEKPMIKNMLIHIIGQISYKKGCLNIVLEHLKKWKNHNLVKKALSEIISVHYSYRKFSSICPEEAEALISKMQIE